MTTVAGGDSREWRKTTHGKDDVLVVLHYLHVVHLKLNDGHDEMCSGSQRRLLMGQLIHAAMTVG